MLINVFASTSGIDEKKTDASLFVQKPYLRTNYIESNTEEDIDMENQIKIGILSDPLALEKLFRKILMIINLTIVE